LPKDACSRQGRALRLLFNGPVPSRAFPFLHPHTRGHLHTQSCHPHFLDFSTFCIRISSFSHHRPRMPAQARVDLLLVAIFLPFTFFIAFSSSHITPNLVSRVRWIPASRLRIFCISHITIARGCLLRLGLIFSLLSIRHLLFFSFPCLWLSHLWLLHTSLFASQSWLSISLHTTILAFSSSLASRSWFLIFGFFFTSITRGRLLRLGLISFCYLSAI